MKKLLPPNAPRGRERGFSLVELVIAILVLSIGLIGLARLFVFATLNAALAVNMSQGLNDAQRLIEVYKTEAAINGVSSSRIVSGTYAATDSSSAYYNAMLANSGTGYRSSDFEEDVWVFDSTGAVITGSYTVNPSLPPGYSAGDLRAPSTSSRLVYVRLTPKIKDPRYNQEVKLIGYVRSN
jgi:prepilin-type N-terminal cleavage/methylation domain-containing protein